MFKYAIIFALAYIGSIHTGYAQEINFKVYTVNDGLVSNNIRRVIQDSKGFLWIATWEGLSKYDGHKFTNFSNGKGISFDLVNDIMQTSDGNIHIAENNGNIDIIRNDRNQKKDVFENMIVNRFFKTSNNKIFAGTDRNGLVEYNGDEFKKSSFNIGNVLDYLDLNDSLKLVITTAYDNLNDKLVILDRNMKIFSQDVINRFTAVRKDSKNNYWLCSYDGLKLLSHVQHRGGPIAYQPLPAQFDIPLLKNVQFDLFEDRDNNYWISNNNGLVRIKPDGKSQLYTIKQGLPANFVSNIIQDREDNIWMCSQAGLVKLVMRNNISDIKNGSLETNEVVSILPVGRKTLYLNTGATVLKLNVNDFSLQQLVPDLPNGGIFSIQELQSKVFAFTVKGQLEIGRDKTPRLFTAAGSVSSYYAVTMDDNKNMFIGTNNGILIKTDRGFFIDSTLATRISTLNFDRFGYLWVGTWYSGLHRLKPVYSKESIHLEKLNDSSIIQENFIRSSFIDKSGNLWVGTRYKGAFKICMTSASEFYQLHFDQRDGLNSNWVKSFEQDHNNNIWVGTHAGLCKLVPDGKNYNVFDFSKINNLYGSVNCIYQDSNRIFWCGRYTGLISFRDDQLDTLSAPEVFITTIKTGKRGDPDKEEVEQAQHAGVSLNYNNNQVYFEFSAPAFINEKQVLYSYRLRGATDTNWTTPANNHVIAYASLEPGHYKFEVRAFGWNGKPGKISAYAFFIRPPFWQTWWFIGICILFVGSLFYAFYRYRLEQFKKLQKVRNRIATDLHDDIGSTLTNISILSELGNKNLQQPQQASKYLERIAEEVNASGQALDDIIWSVNSKNDTLEEMLVRMRRFAAELFDHSNVKYKLELKENATGKKVNMEQRRDVYLIYKESLNNIYKHAAAQNVYVELSMSRNSLTLTINDDGKGFNPQLVTERNGIKNLKTRVEKWRGELLVRSEAETGTSIKVIMPVKE